MNPPSAAIAKDIANPATPERMEMIATAAHDLHRAARIHARVRLRLAWYIPPTAILQGLRRFGVPA